MKRVKVIAFLLGFTLMAAGSLVLAAEEKQAPQPVELEDADYPILTDEDYPYLDEEFEPAEKPAPPSAPVPQE